MSTNESETQLSAPTSLFEQSPKRLAQKGQGKQRICPITEQAFHIARNRFRLMGIAPSVRCPPIEP